MNYKDQITAEALENKAKRINRVLKIKSIAERRSCERLAERRRDAAERAEVRASTDAYDIENYDLS